MRDFDMNCDTNFKIGDLVTVVVGYYDSGVNGGEQGTIVSASGELWGVEFVTEKSPRHDCGGPAKEGYGWYLRSHQLRLTNSKERNKTMRRIEYIGDYPVTIQSRSDLRVGCVAVTRRQLEDLLDDLEDYCPPPKEKLMIGDRVRLTRALSNHGKYGWITRIDTHNRVYVRVVNCDPDIIQEKFSYAAASLDIVSKKEYDSHTQRPLKVGDTVLAHRVLSLIEEGMKEGTIISIRNNGLEAHEYFYNVEFPAYSAVRAKVHTHLPGERYGHVGLYSRDELELRQPTATPPHHIIEYTF